MSFLLRLRVIFVAVMLFFGTILLLMINRQEFLWSKVRIPKSLNRSKARFYNNNRNPIIKWYFSSGNSSPHHFKGVSGLFPSKNSGDRIEDQLMYVPENYFAPDTKKKLIYLYHGFRAWGNPKNPFEECPVSSCSLISRARKAPLADAILVKNGMDDIDARKSQNQVWIMYFLECPFYTPRESYKKLFNWTATYRMDSDIVTPYEKWTYYDPNVRQKPQKRNYAENKTKKVAWFVSNCRSSNERLQYARELLKYISVDIYGSCGTLKCPKNEARCYEALDRDYKFYLAFENSNCRDYITEKFYVNALMNNVLPIAMGAKRDDYLRSAPEHSFIHVDDFTNPEDLASYLHLLDKNDEMYNSYFKWKGTGEFINTYFWCRLCAMLHAPLTPKHYEDINDWWRGAGVCVKKGPWPEE